MTQREKTSLSVRYFNRAAATLLSLAFAGAAYAAPTSADTKARFEKRLNISATSVLPTPLPGIFEVVVSGKVMYTDKSGRYLLQGDIVDLESKTNLTEVKRSAINHVNVDLLPKDGGVKTVIGNGSRMLYTFEDPNCSYCKRLSGELAQLKNVTVVTYPVAILGADSLVRSQFTLCAKDPSLAWSQLMSGSADSYGVDQGCKSLGLVDRNTKLMASMGFGGTPAIVFADGTRIPGFSDAKQIEARMAAAELRLSGKRGARK